MHWAFLVLIGAILNGFLNYGYKAYAVKINFLYLIPIVFATGAAILAAYTFLFQPGPAMITLSGRNFLVIGAMGVGTSFVMIMMLTALKKGPISLVDPMFACIYALVSVIIGIIVVKESPGTLSLCGILFYLVGVALMAAGNWKKADIKNADSGNHNP